ncbi:Polyadenylate-binding protein [Durusdinium trenchii]|uniref:Cytoplasmic and nuclear (PABP) (Poly(A)-binding protein) (Polyadenylate tail-binding protein) n=2 Tax=Durusdinium trenchii TaxID=1381693 RepID=A0ABP0IA50_9DINO
MPAARPSPPRRGPALRNGRRSKADDYSDAYSDYYSDEYTRSGRSSSVSSRTFSIGDLSRSSSRRSSRRSAKDGRPRSVAGSEDYHELKDYMRRSPPRLGRVSRRPSRSRRRVEKPRAKEKPLKRKRVELLPNKAVESSTNEVQRVRLECRRAKELARKAQAECLEAKEESRRAKEESERVKEQIRVWTTQHWQASEENWDDGWESEWPRPDEAKWGRSHPKASLISAPERRRTSEKAAWWHGEASWASHAEAWARGEARGLMPRPTPKLTNAEVRHRAQSGQAQPEGAKEMRMLVKNIKTTKLRREFQKRMNGHFGGYKKDRDERRAGRASRKTTDPYSVLFAHLSRRVPEEYLKSLFSEVGHVESFELWKGPDGQSVGRGKVTYSSTAHAAMAVKQLSGWYVHGRTMRVCLWRPVSEECGEYYQENKPPEKPCSVTFSNCNAVSTEGFLRWLFSKAGTVLCFALQRSDDGKSLGWGSCTFDSKSAAERAVQRFNGAWVDNRQIHLEVDLKPPKSFRPCVFFHNVSWTTSAFELRKRLEQYGTLEEFELRVKPNGRSLGMGTCRFSSTKEAKAAIAAMDGHMMKGRRLYVCRYDPIGAGRIQARRPWENCPPEVKEEIKSEDEEDGKKTNATAA